MLRAVGNTNNNTSGDKDAIRTKFTGITMKKQNLK